MQVPCESKHGAKTEIGTKNSNRQESDPFICKQTFVSKLPAAASDSNIIQHISGNIWQHAKKQNLSITVEYEIFS